MADREERQPERESQGKGSKQENGPVRPSQGQGRSGQEQAGRNPQEGTRREERE